MKMKRIAICLLLAGSIASCKDEPELRQIESSVNLEIEYSKEVYKPGATVFGSKNYVEIIVGDAASPIILASPHDGTLEIAEIPDRNHSTAVLVRDLYVTDLVLKMADSIKNLTGLRPHVIINLLPRKKMEPNRALADAYLKHPDAETAWREYQDFIKIARSIVKENVGKGLFLDMHGHGHTKVRIEVGYLLSRNDLNNADESIDFMSYKSSIYGLAKNSAYPFSQLINGDVSLGTLLADNSCPSVPSKQDPRPFDDEYFDGGYCTSTYGSRSSEDNIDAIQLETPGTNIRNTAAQRTASSGRIARAIIKYMELNYNMDLMKQQ